MPHDLPPPSSSSPNRSHRGESFSLGQALVRLVVAIVSIGLSVAVGALLLAVAAALLLGMGLRRLIARLRGEPVAPWALPLWWHAARSRQTIWPERARTHTVRTDDGDEVEIVEAANDGQRPQPKRPFARNRRAARADITDVQPTMHPHKDEPSSDAADAGGDGD